MAIFEAWLGLNLQRQILELKRYISNQEAPPGAVLVRWTHLKPYQRLIPSGAMQAQRDLFLKDMETMLRILVSQEGSERW